MGEFSSCPNVERRLASGKIIPRRRRDGGRGDLVFVDKRQPLRSSTSGRSRGLRVRRYEGVLADVLAARIKREVAATRSPDPWGRD